MPPVIENAALRMVLSLPTARWSVSSRQWEDLGLDGILMGLTYRRAGHRVRTLDGLQAAHILSEETLPSAHGPLRQVSLEIEPVRGGMPFQATFALPVEQPMIFWRLEVSNPGPRPLYMERLDLLRVGYPRKPGTAPTAGESLGRDRYQGAVRLPPESSDLVFFAHGWGSWTDSGVYSAWQRQRQTRMGFLRTPATLNLASPRPQRRGHFVSEMFAVLGDRGQRIALLAGFLTQRQHFGSLELWATPPHPSFSMWAQGDGARLDPGQRLVTDWACLLFLHLDSPDPLGPYLEAVAREHDLPAQERALPTGWCSWYHFRQGITAAQVRDNLAAIQAMQPDLPLNLVQIDDGYQARVGDWDRFSSGFPAGVAPLAAETRKAGLTPGLWLAPFIVDPRSRLAQSHPGWLLRNRLGLPVNAGFHWNRLARALDLTHPEALAYAAEAVHTAVHRWGFPYLKLDFLYAGALPGRRHDRTRTRAQALRAGLQALRQAAGETAFLLGCGAPLGPAIGLMDAMRIGPDVAGFWDPQYRGIKTFFSREPDIPAAVHSVRSALARAPLHRRWWLNDPDCLLVRPDTDLSLAEVQSLATVIALTGGSILVSDHIPDLPEERLDLLSSLLPPLGRTPHIMDWFDSSPPACLQLDLDGPAGPWHLLAQFNWEDHARDLDLNLADFYLDPQADYLAREFWRGEIHLISSGSMKLESVPAHGAAVLALRRTSPHQPQYLGSSLHISQGLEVSTWESEPESLTFELTRPGRAQGAVDLRCPKPPRGAFSQGSPLPTTELKPKIYRLGVEFYQTTEIKIEW